jgi:hypothetical protein
MKGLILILAAPLFALAAVAWGVIALCAWAFGSGRGAL